MRTEVGYSAFNRVMAIIIPVSSKIKVVNISINLIVLLKINATRVNAFHWSRLIGISSTVLSSSSIPYSNPTLLLHPSRLTDRMRTTFQ